VEIVVVWSILASKEFKEFEKLMQSSEEVDELLKED
jgi:hypothetical protein